MTHARKTFVAAVALLAIVLTAAVWAARHEETELPETVKAAVQKAYPNARIGDVERERRIVQLYLVEVTIDGQEHELTVTPEGYILAMKDQVELGTMPEAAQATVRKVIEESKLGDIDRVKVLAELEPAALKEPRYEYEVEFERRGHEYMVILSAEGKFLWVPSSMKHLSDGDHDNHGEDDD